MRLLLEPEQEELLCLLVEASRKVPRDEGQEFKYCYDLNGNRLSHPGLPKHSPVPQIPDLEVLARNNLIRIRPTGPRPEFFYVTPEGFSYYLQIKQRLGIPPHRVEATVKSYLSGDPFRSVYPLAYDRWTQAEEKLWQGSSSASLSSVGHLCREALQEFTAVLIQGQPNPPPKERTVARLRAVIANHAGSCSDSVAASLDALIVFWGTVSDLVQRQEHAGQKEGAPITWEDARRVVFMSFYVMYEIDRALRMGSSAA